MEQTNKIFVKFLKDNHVLKQYIKNLKNDNKNQFLTWENHTNPFTIRPLEQCLNDSRWICNLISTAFWWSGTQEGRIFWSDLDAKWRKQLKWRTQFK